MIWVYLVLNVSECNLCIAVHYSKGYCKYQVMNRFHAKEINKNYLFVNSFIFFLNKAKMQFCFSNIKFRELLLILMYINILKLTQFLFLCRLCKETTFCNLFAFFIPLYMPIILFDLNNYHYNQE